MKINFGLDLNECSDELDELMAHLLPLEVGVADVVGWDPSELVIHVEVDPK
jgi:hypothetical protein